MSETIKSITFQLKEFAMLILSLIYSIRFCLWGMLLVIVYAHLWPDSLAEYFAKKNFDF